MPRDLQSRHYLVNGAGQRQINMVVFRSSSRGCNLAKILTTYWRHSRVIELISIMVWVRADQIVLVPLPGTPPDHPTHPTHPRPTSLIIDYLQVLDHSALCTGLGTMSADFFNSASDFCNACCVSVLSFPSQAALLGFWPVGHILSLVEIYNTCKINYGLKLLSRRHWFPIQQPFICYLPKQCSLALTSHHFSTTVCTHPLTWNIRTEFTAETVSFWGSI